MASVTGNGGVSYSTDDLIRMANINTFGDMSEAIWGALNHSKKLEKENAHLKAHIQQLTTPQPQENV